MEVLGALASVLSIWLVTGILVYEAVNRMLNPVAVNGKSVITTHPLTPPACTSLGYCHASCVH